MLKNKVICFLFSLPTQSKYPMPLVDEKITVAFWETKQKEIIGEQSALQEQLARLKTEEAKYFEIWLNIIDLARRAREIYEKRTPEQRRVLLSHIFSNLVLKDGKVLPTLKKSTEALAKRVQERLDVEKSLELQKALVIKGRKAHKTPQTDSLLPLASELRTFFSMGRILVPLV